MLTAVCGAGWAEDEALFRAAVGAGGHAWLAVVIGFDAGKHLVPLPRVDRLVLAQRPWRRRPWLIPVDGGD
jgi:hypothetical protein